MRLHDRVICVDVERGRCRIEFDHSTSPTALGINEAKAPPGWAIEASNKLRHAGVLVKAKVEPTVIGIRSWFVLADVRSSENIGQRTLHVPTRDGFALLLASTLIFLGFLR